MDDMQEVHLSLRQKLQQFEMNRQQIGEAIVEVKRRIKVLEEAMSWDAVTAEPH